MAAQVLKQPENFPDLMECLWSPDRLVRMRAADAAEKASAQRPDLLQPFQAELLGLAGETREAEVRWHLAQMIPRLKLTPGDRERAIGILHLYLEDRSSIVKTSAIQGLADLGADLTDVLEEVRRTGTPAMKARCRKLFQ